MATFDYAMCHNLGPFKINVHNGWPRSMVKILKSHPKFLISATLWILVSPNGTITSHWNLMAWIFFNIQNDCFKITLILKCGK